MSALRDALHNSSDEYGRLQAICALGEIGASSCIYDLVSPGSYCGPLISKEINRVLTEMQQSHCIPDWIDAYKNLDGSSKEKVLTVLSNIHYRESLRYWLMALDDKDSMVRQQAIWALHDIREPAAIHYLLNIMKTSDEDTKFHATRVLASFRSPNAVPYWQDALADNDPDIHTIASNALSEIYKHHPYLLQMQDRFSKSAGLPVFTSAQSSKRTGDVNDPTSAFYWQAILESLDIDADSRVLAIQVLHQLKNPSVIRTLSEQLTNSNDNVRYHAVCALRYITSVNSNVYSNHMHMILSLFEADGDRKS